MAQFGPPPPCPDGAAYNLAAILVIVGFVIVASLVWMIPEMADVWAQRLALRAKERREMLDLLKQQRERRKAECAKSE